MTPIKQEDLAYIAGFFDGEGSIYIATSKRPQNFLTVSISNIDKHVLEFIKEQFGFGSICLSHDKKRKRRILYRLRVYSKNALVFLDAIYPFLRVKQKQAELAIEFQRGLVDGKHISDDLRRKQEMYKDRIHELNNAGERNF